MKREEILERLGFKVSDNRKRRVLIHSDINNEADDQYAIIHHLLSPTEDVIGIIAGHYEGMYRMVQPLMEQMGISAEQMNENIHNHVPGFDTLSADGESMEDSFQEGVKLLELAEMEDIPLLRGSKYPLENREDIPESEGADFIIREALNEDERPLYIPLQGCLTDLAIAYIKEPRIAEKVIAIWIGGGKYPQGDDEFNLKQDVIAARIVFESNLTIWQIPSNVYNTMEISFAELAEGVKPCGKIGAYLYEEMTELGFIMGQNFPGNFPQGETWCIGDNPTVSVLLQSEQRECWHTEKAPFINDDCTYTPNENGKEIRVYDSVDTRLTISDLLAKLKRCYC